MQRRFHLAHCRTWTNTGQLASMATPIMTSGITNGLSTAPAVEWARMTTLPRASRYSRSTAPSAPPIVTSVWAQPLATSELMSANSIVLVYPSLKVESLERTHIFDCIYHSCIIVDCFIHWYKYDLLYCLSKPQKSIMDEAFPYYIVNVRRLCRNCKLLVLDHMMAAQYISLSDYR